MRTVLKIVKPLLALLLAVGVIRFALTAGGAPRSVVYLFSVTIASLAFSLYFMVKVRREASIGPVRLWAGNFLILATGQILIIAGLVHTLWSGRSSYYHETQRLIDFLGYEPTIPEHIGMHVINWMGIAPVLLTVLIGLPLMYFSRRRA